MAEPQRVAQACDDLTVLMRSCVEQLLKEEEGLAFVAVAQYLSGHRHNEEAEALKELFNRPEEDLAVVREALRLLGHGGLTKVAHCN